MGTMPLALLKRAYSVRHMFRYKQFRSCTLGQDVFSKTFLTKFVATYPSYTKYKKNHHRSMVQNLELQIYIEKMLERPQSLFMQKRLYSTAVGLPKPRPRKDFRGRGIPEVTWIGDGVLRLFSDLEAKNFKVWLRQTLQDFYRTILIIVVLELIDFTKN